jgi:TolB protein
VALAAPKASWTVLDGFVVAFFWSPDGRTLAALRLQVPSGQTAAAGGTAASPSAAPNEVHLLFVDARSGDVRSDRVVRPGRMFVSNFLPYFDQYATSHRLWAPDGSSFLLPIDDDNDDPTVVAYRPDGGDPAFSIAAMAAFWSP